MLIRKSRWSKTLVCLGKKKISILEMGVFCLLTTKYVLLYGLAFSSRKKKRNLYKNSKKDLFFPVPVFLIYIPISSGLSSLSFLFLPMEYSVQRSQSDRKKEQWALPAAYPIKNEKFKMIIRQ